ncbi:hypothetical protein D3C81_1797370 [compost metagenome]
MDLGSMAIIGPDCSSCRNIGMEMVSTLSAGVAMPASLKASSRRSRIGVPTGYSTHGQSPNASSGVQSRSLSGWPLLTTRQNGSGSSAWKSKTWPKRSSVKRPIIRSSLFCSSMASK